MTLEAAFGNVIRQLRNEKGLSQAKVSRVRLAELLSF